MSIEKLFLKDIVDLEYLQKLQDTFARVAQITSVIIGTDGIPITKPSNLGGFCEAMYSYPDSSAQCLSTNLALIDHNIKTKKSHHMICPHSGLTTASVPIFVNDTLIACWIIGQLRIEDPPNEILENTAKKTGLSSKSLKVLLQSLPICSSEQFEYIFEYLEVMTDTIINLARLSHDAETKNKSLIKVTTELENFSQMMTTFMDSSSSPMCVCDIETGRFLMVNETLADLLERTKHDILGNTLWNILSPEFKEIGLFPEFPVDLVDTNEIIIYSESRKQWLRRVSKNIRWTYNKSALMLTFFDITAEKNAQTHLEHLAYYDRASGLPNLLKLTDDFMSSKNGSFIINFDIKELRRINDAYGRTAGDVLISEIVKFVDKKLSDSEKMYRVDGDEFAILFNNATKEDVQFFATMIMDKFKNEWELRVNSEITHIFCEINVCIIDGNVQFSLNDSLKSYLDRAMDASIAENTVAIYDEEMDLAFKEHLFLELSLRDAINHDMSGFYLVYQPIVSVETAKWHGFEVLCRWNSPEFGPISPAVFIHETERLGLMDKLGQWVLEEGVKQCKEWGLDRLDDFILEVNFSPVQIADSKLEKKVLRILQKYDFPGEKLCIEITESMELMLNPHIIKSIENLCAHNISVALDDFGIGYSSFQSLKSMPANTLKTEYQFVRNIENDAYLRDLFEMIAHLAHIAGKKLVAEGIENEAQLNIVVKRGADYIQGYLFGKPLAKHECEGLLYRFNEKQRLLLR